MIRRITLANFMSHQETVIDPAEGLTVLVGENNCGKSAIVAAIQTLCQNLSGGYMVRHGENDCRVKIETSNGNEFEWRRIKKKVSYCINGIEIDRLKGNVPENLHEQLRLPLVDANGELFDVHFGEQKQPIFLLNKSGSHRAAFFASSSDAGKLIEMQNRHRSNVSAKRNDEKRLNRQATRLQAKRDELQPLDEIHRRLCETENQFETINGNQRLITKLEKLIEKIEAATLLKIRLQASTKILACIGQPPVLKPVDQLRLRIENIQSMEQSVARSTAVHSALQRLIAPPVAEPTQDISQLIQQLINTRHQIDRNRETELAITELSNPPELANTIALRRLIFDLENIQRRFQLLVELTETLCVCQPPVLQQTKTAQQLVSRLSHLEISINRYQAQLDLLNSIPVPVIPVPSTALKQLAEDLQRAQLAVGKLEDKLDARQQALKEAEHDLKHCADENQSCPLCGQPIDGDVLVAKAAIESGGGSS